MTDLHRARLEAAGLKAALAAHIEAVENYSADVDKACRFTISERERADLLLDAEAARTQAEDSYLREHPEAVQ